MTIRIGEFTPGPLPGFGKNEKGQVTWTPTGIAGQQGIEPIVLSDTDVARLPKGVLESIVDPFSKVTEETEKKTATDEWNLFPEVKLPSLESLNGDDMKVIAQIFQLFTKMG